MRKYFLHFRNVLLNLCNNSDQTLSFINIRKVPREVLKTEGEVARSSGRLKTEGFALGFQHFPRDLANVNEWKIMFNPSNEAWL